MVDNISRSHVLNSLLLFVFAVVGGICGIVVFV